MAAQHVSKHPRGKFAVRQPAQSVSGLLARAYSLRKTAVQAVIGLGLSAALFTAPMVHAQEQSEAAAPVLLELYTSQGCASCPPADEMMLDLSLRDDVIALALHVDYWDYIGWIDSLADPEYGERQKRYARRNGHTTIYTPQVVVNGLQVVEGYRVPQVMDVIDAELARRPEVSLALTRQEGGQLHIHAESLLAPSNPLLAMASRRAAIPGAAQGAVVGSLSMDGAANADQEPMDPAAIVMTEDQIAMDDFVVDLVRFRRYQEVEITGGENSGLLAQYANVVTEWRTVGGWNMSTPLDLTLEIDGDDAVVVIIQEYGQGEIVAAAQLR